MRRLRVLFLLAFATMLAIGCSQQQNIPVGPNTDTVYVEVEVIDSVFVPVVDTLVQIDTLILAQDTVYRYDTLIVVDTVVQHDSTIVYDTTTVMVVDTLVQYDTTYVVHTVLQYCDEIENADHGFAWILNETGAFALHFYAELERVHPQQEVYIKLNEGDPYTWIPADGLEFYIEEYLMSGDVITVWTGPPHAFGHSIAICMYLEQ